VESQFQFGFIARMVLEKHFLTKWAFVFTVTDRVAKYDTHDFSWSLLSHGSV